MTTDNSTAPAQGLTDEELARIAYKGFDDYWTEDCAGKESEAWAASAKAVLNAALVAAPPELPAGYLQQRIDWERSQEDRSLLAAARRAAAPHTATPASQWPLKPLEKVQVYLPDGKTQAMCYPVFAYFDAGSMDELEHRLSAAPVVQPVVPMKSLSAAVADALRPFMANGQKVIWREPFRWFNDNGVMPNHYDGMSLDSLAAEFGYEVIHDCGCAGVIKRAAQPVEPAAPASDADSMPAQPTKEN